MEPQSPHDHPAAARLSRATLKPVIKKYTRSKRFLLLMFFAAVGMGMLLAWTATRGTTTVVPKKIQTAVPFKIYYPANLPTGYTLEMTSFQLPEPGVVLFTVTDGRGRKIIFSEQEQPSGGDIDKFVSNYLPLNTIVNVPLGQAKVGAYGSAPNIRTLVSLPIRSGPWLIVTAPADVSHDELTSILSSLAK